MKATDRISLILKEKGISKYKFNKDLGFSNGFLEGSRHIGSDKCAKILKYFDDLNLVWLITGEGEMIDPNQNTSITEPISTYQLKDERNLNNQRIPLYDAEAVAGIVPIFHDLNSEEPVDYLQIPNAPKCDGAMYASGDSMYPIVKSGDILGYKEIKDMQNNIFWGQMYILYIDIEGELMRTVKYVQKGSEDNYIKLVSENKHHEAKEVCLDKITAMAQVKITVRLN